MTTGELIPERKSVIDRLSLYRMLELWRFAPVGSFQIGDPTSDYFQRVMAMKREADPVGWTQASKALSRRIVRGK